MATIPEGLKGPAIVTGASRGIGAEIADRLATDGYFVIGTASSVGNAQDITTRFNDLGATGVGVELKLDDPVEMAPWYKEITDAYGKPTTLVNNAGITADALFLKQTTDVVDNVMTINFASPFELMCLVAKDMRKQRDPVGNIVNISSVSGYAMPEGQSSYAASKAALDAATQVVAKETKGRPRINSLALGAVNTDMFAATPAAAKEHILAATNTGEPMLKSVVADAVMHIINQGSHGKTGQVYHFNDGLYHPSFSIKNQTVLSYNVADNGTKRFYRG